MVEQNLYNTVVKKTSEKVNDSKVEAEKLTH